MKFLTLLFVTFLAGININAQRHEVREYPDAIDVVGERPARTRPDRETRGGSDGADRSNTKVVEVNGKSYNVSKGAKKQLNAFLAEYNLMQDVGRFVPGKSWEAATKAKAERFIKDRILEAALKNNRGNEKMWEAVLDGLRKSGLLDKSAERRIEKAQRKAERAQAQRRGTGGGDRH